MAAATHEPSIRHAAGAPAVDGYVPQIGVIRRSREMNVAGLSPRQRCQLPTSASGAPMATACRSLLLATPRAGRNADGICPV